MIYVAVDLGASSGRILIGNKTDNTITFQEVHRFSNNIEEKNNRFYWNIDYLSNELLIGLQKVKQSGYEKCYLGIDTWGVDYVLTDDTGNKLREVLSYRNFSSNKLIDEFSNMISKEKIYVKTGIQFMPFNTLYQLYKDNAYLLENTNNILLMPDYLAYYLTDIAVTELTNASTTQLLNIETKNWDPDLLKILSIKNSQFPKLVEPGTKLGNLKKEKFPKFDLPECTLISVASHDTASAVASTPGFGENWAFLSSGTWSLLGMELKHFINNNIAQKNNYTNEYGYANTNRFLKNIMGLWILQEIRKNNFSNYSFDELEEEAKKSNNFSQYINLNDSRFLNPKNMLEEIQNYCSETNQSIPKSVGEIINAILCNLAIIYSIALDELEKITSKSINTLHIVGGGAYYNFLNQITADLSNKKVLAGPTEASALGNFLVQMITSGCINDISEGRKIIKNSFEIKEYTPKNTNRENIINKFMEVTKYE
ncbi:MAG: rhamnulokinase [Clostridiales bacterium]